MYLLETNIPDSYKNFYYELLGGYKEYLKSIGLNTNRSVISYENSLKCFLRNENIGGKSISISSDKNYFSNRQIKNCRYTKNTVSYIFTQRLYNWLLSESYCTIDKGGCIDRKFIYSGGDKKWHTEWIYKSSVLTFTDRWFKLKESFVKYDEIVPVDNVIFMKNKSKDYITYKIDFKLKEKREYLKNLNKFNARNVLEVKGRRYPLQSYKVFNESSGKVGGRTYTYCGYQNLNKEERMHSMINGNPTVALDYGSFEASVMYTLVGEVMEMNDPYYVGIEGYDPQFERHVMKKCFMILMNSSSRLQALATIRNWLESDDFDVDALYKNSLIPSKKLPAKLFLEKLEDKHSKVKDYFYSGKNENFNIQNITAEVNDFVVGYLFGEENIMVAQVHDCFIVEQQHRDLLMHTMFKGYETVLGDVTNCRVNQEF